MCKYTVLLTLALLAGCATSSITGTKDPSFDGHRFHKAGVFALDMNSAAASALEQRICAKLTACVSGKALFPSARSVDEIQSALQQHGIDVALVVRLVSDASSTTTSALASSHTTTAGVASLYGNIASYSGSAYTTTTVIPIQSRNRTVTGELALYAISSARLAWHGQIDVNGRGVASSDEALIRSASQAIASEIRKTDLLD